jgi:TonB family protein
MKTKMLFLLLGYFAFYRNEIPAQTTPTDSSKIRPILDKEPSPKGGFQAFYQYISRSIRYPNEARDQGIEGKVVIQFIVNPDSSLSDIQVVKGIGGGCDEEALRIVRNSPKWIPGEQNNRRVKAYMNLPIMFKLEGDYYPIVRKRLVIVDEVEAGMVDMQKSIYNELKIDARKVKNIQYLTIAEAQAKYGEKGKNGAVIISTKKKKK